jgi:hypothetical protein
MNLVFCIFSLVLVFFCYFFLALGILVLGSLSRFVVLRYPTIASSPYICALNFNDGDGMKFSQPQVIPISHLLRNSFISGYDDIWPITLKIIEVLCF